MKDSTEIHSNNNNKKFKKNNPDSHISVLAVNHSRHHLPTV